MKMVPRVAVPTTAPSSYAVSDTAEAAPDFAGSTDATMVSFEMVCEIPTPSSRTRKDTMTATTVRSCRNSRMARKPAATSTSPTIISACGANRFASGTTAMPATI
ncbi:MAG: hypothetical protein ACRDUX_38320, partial [Mycobacterium sp.]